MNKIIRYVKIIVLANILMLLATLLVKAQDTPDKKLRFSGDFRYRFEQDWNSRLDDGAFRTDRFRMRYRFRLGFTYQLNKFFYFGGRVRTGIASNMQSPHINVGYNGFTSAPFNISKAYLGGKYRDLWWWVGKNSYPFWKQNELFWDDDVTPEGITVGGKFSNGNLKINPTIGYYITNHNQQVDYVDGTMAIVQLAAVLEASNKITLDMAIGYNQLDNIFDKPEHLGGTDRIDYKFLILGARAKIKTKLPLEIGIDYANNLEDYTSSNIIDDHYKDQKKAFVGHLQIGKSKNKGDWLLGYYYAYKQKYSVVDYYTEDDWVRWGNINRNRNTNYAGHELRFGYTFAPKFNMVLRAYTVEALVKRLENNAIATETGNRIRLDLNIKF